MFANYWKKRAQREAQGVVDAQQQHMRDMIALVDAAGGVIRVEPETLLMLPRMGISISPLSDGSVEYRRHFQRRGL